MSEYPEDTDTSLEGLKSNSEDYRAHTEEKKEVCHQAR